MVDCRSIFESQEAKKHSILISLCLFDHTLSENSIDTYFFLARRKWGVERKYSVPY